MMSKRAIFFALLSLTTTIALAQSQQTNTGAPATTPQAGGAPVANTSATNSNATNTNAPGSQAQTSYRGNSNQNNASQASANAATKPDDKISPPVPPGPTDNNLLQSNIDNAMRREPSLSNSQVTVHVSDVAIDLGGSVSSVKDRQTAERIAQSFSVDRKLNDKLVVTGASQPKVPSTTSAAENTFRR